MLIVRVLEIDGSPSVLLPTEVLRKLHVAEGDEIFLTETPDGYELSSEVTRQLRIGREIMKKRRDVLSKLAKS
jgi:hypothetical protein